MLALVCQTILRQRSYCNNKDIDSEDTHMNNALLMNGVHKILIYLVQRDQESDMRVDSTLRGMQGILSIYLQKRTHRISHGIARLF